MYYLDLSIIFSNFTSWLIETEDVVSKNDQAEVLVAVEMGMIMLNPKTPAEVRFNTACFSGTPETSHMYGECWNDSSL